MHCAVTILRIIIIMLMIDNEYEHVIVCSRSLIIASVTRYDFIKVV